jgi:hypothetical protein
MVVTEPKPLKEILKAIEERGFHKLAIIGCGSCATLAGTGGEKEVEAMKQQLVERGYEVVFTGVLETACHERLAARIVRQLPEQTQAVLVLACGSGVQNLADVYEGIVLAGLNTLFVGKTKKAGFFLEYCLHCGDCILNETGGICPKARCPKNMLNGPCGGMYHGKCEVHPDNECVWVKIYRKVGIESAEKIRWSNNKKSNFHPLKVGERSDE